MRTSAALGSTNSTGRFPWRLSAEGARWMSTPTVSRAAHVRRPHPPMKSRLTPGPPDSGIPYQTASAIQSVAAATPVDARATQDTTELEPVEVDLLVSTCRTLGQPTALDNEAGMNKRWT